MTTVEDHSCLLNMHVTFDLAEIEELMPQQARKQLEAELEKSCCSLGGVRCLYTAILVSPVQSSPVQSSVEGQNFELCGSHYPIIFKFENEVCKVEMLWIRTKVLTIHQNLPSPSTGRL